MIIDETKRISRYVSLRIRCEIRLVGPSIIMVAAALAHIFYKQD